MKNYLKLLTLAIALSSFTACANKDKETDEADPVETTTNEDGTTVIINADDDGVDVKSKDGANVDIDIDKKGGSVSIEDDSTKINVKIKDDKK